MNYIDIFSKYERFMSFDISVHSTGWCKWDSGILTFGSFGLASRGDLERRMEFREKVIELIGTDNYQFISIEDVIGGCNFETTKSLIQLNTIIDDLNYWGIIKSDRIDRISNTVWKKRLRELVGGNGVSAYIGDVKEEIKRNLNTLGFYQDGVQDIYDAVGIAVGDILGRSLLKSGVKPTKGKLKTKLESYDMYRYTDEKLLKLENDTGLTCMKVEYEGSGYKDALLLFKDTILNYGDEHIFVIEAPMSKFGVLALSGKIPMKDDDTKFIAVKRGINKRR